MKKGDETGFGIYVWGLLAGFFATQIAQKIAGQYTFIDLLAELAVKK